MTKKLSLKKLLVLSIVNQILVSQLFNLVLAYFLIDLTILTLVNCVELLVIGVSAYKAFSGYHRCI